MPLAREPLRRHLLVAVLLLAAAVPLVILVARKIDAQNHRRATVSCANHSSFTGKHFSVDELPKTLTNSVEFADYLEQLYAGQTQRPALSCPGARWSRTKTGVAFVGAGFDLLATAPTEEVLIAFCHYESHPVPYDHSHSLSLHSNRFSNEGFRGRPIDRSCDSIRDMTNRLSTAIQQGRDRIVPYTPAAMAVLQSELNKRLQCLAENPTHTEPRRK